MSWWERQFYKQLQGDINIEGNLSAADWQWQSFTPASYVNLTGTTLFYSEYKEMDDWVVVRIKVHGTPGAGVSEIGFKLDTDIPAADANSGCLSTIAISSTARYGGYSYVSATDEIRVSLYDNSNFAATAGFYVNGFYKKG